MLSEIGVPVPPTPPPGTAMAARITAAGQRGYRPLRESVSPSPRHLPPVRFGSFRAILGEARTIPTGMSVTFPNPEPRTPNPESRIPSPEPRKRRRHA
ncbi:MAG: hypothetical protein FWD58_10775 [Firmicutes bacterium]|nr:hypothetical protein [Bacillota bacterium]